MQNINNPVIPGMAPDPSIIRVGNDYYLATSTFHWKPAIQIFHSTDLVNWTFLTYVLKENEVDLRGTNTPAGIWAPHLSYDTKNETFWIAYSHMQNMAGREFNSDSFAIHAKNLKGPWSKPIYLTSIGFDPSLYHDSDGKHYVSILEWETRTGYQAPGHIVIAEFDLTNQKIVGKWHRVTTGFTTRGCVEAPQLYQHNGYYYLMLASGGTGYAHGIEIGRSKKVFGPYEAEPTGEPIITSSPHHLFSLGDPDAGHFEMFNPHSNIQKSGHGSLVSTPDNEWYIAHLMSRPLPGTKFNPLGRETAIQKMRWTDEGWLEMEDGSNLAKDFFVAPQATAEPQTFKQFDINESFDKESYDGRFMTPYHNQNPEWVNIDKQNQHLRIYGRNSLFSQFNPSIMATRATSLNYLAQTKLTFNPNHYSQTAGLGLYYDSNNWVFARITLSDDEKRPVLRILQAEKGNRNDHIFSEVAIPKKTVEIRLNYKNGIVQFEYCLDTQWKKIDQPINVSYLSDEGVNGEPGEIGGFTGLFNFIGAVDAYQHASYADFDYYKVINN
ncbi:family 43 glycosylhydrolase [Pediococcus acidilactici]|uniref:family 43 glycosylhydrolase n=1 Tax=Pediococcus acidilactici TaxID=1254 RepID=UPI00097EE903|nr:family 43 glycosylhydrolase [Pediococcus acidilactici]MCH9266974.1 family 43 glycosylhydrolase [Pediococcus acidilactici]MCK2074282.1 family 43 glycosylhydrolase [Pediococcus acidilactici]MDV2603769.1 family 43 glycosylhydrolase [Pediococcus acidilactici]MDV2845188.1 family 43 glycosylhydrolase [Pediococcus acidilactici]RWY85386.1 glycoside hydrolase family 43 protein [Pediococcus acidilactici]